MELKTFFRTVFLGSLFTIFALGPYSPNIVAQHAAELEGVVVDQDGHKVAGAIVILTSRAAQSFATTTNDSGSYKFGHLDTGTYLIEVRADGFSTFVSDDIVLQRGSSKEFKVELRVAAIRENVVVSATGTAQRLDEVAKAITTVDSGELEARHELTVAESLRGVPGVRIQQQGSPGALTSLRLRGQRTFDTAILLDGLRVRDAGDINGSALSLLSDLVPVTLDRIEVLRGSGSSIYGTHAIGGVVNMIPATAVPGIHFEGGFEAGGLGLFRERLQLSGGSEKLGFIAGAHRLDVRKGIDGDDQYGDTGLEARLQFHPLHSITISGNFYGMISNARLNDSPFALSNAFIGSQKYPRAGAGVTFQPDFNNPDQGRRSRLLVGSVRFSQLAGSKISYSVAYQRVSSNRRNYNGPMVDTRYASFVPFGDFEFLSVNRGTVDTVDGRVNVQVTHSNLATIGFEFERESLFQNSQPSFSTFNNTTDRQRSYALFVQDQISLLRDRLQISIGARRQSFRLRAADRPGQLHGRSSEGSVTGDGSVAYFFNSLGTKVRAHVGNGFRAPSLFERFGEGTFGNAGVVRFGDPTLRAEQSIAIDGGFDQRLAGERLVFGSTYFYTKLQRVVAFTGFTVDPLGLGRFSGYVNRPGGISRGIENYVNAAPIRGMELRASYTFTNSDRFIPGRGLEPEYVIPKHTFGLTWTERYRALLLNFDLNRTGAYLAPVFENNFPFRMAELKFAGFTKADVFLSYESARSETVKIVFFGGIENVLHEKYFENGFLAPRSTVRGGIKVKF